MLLAAAVLGLHLWLLSGTPRVLQPNRPATWHARSVAPPAPAAARAAPEAASVSAERKPERARLPPRGAAGTGRSTAADPTGPAALPAAAPLPLTRFAVPGPARWHYQVNAQVRGVVTQGEATLRWQHDGSRYEAQLELNAPGLRRRLLHSAGWVTPQGLAPLRFADKSRSEEAVHFEREAGKLSFSSNRPEAALEAGAQDRLSVILQLGAMIAADPQEFPPGTRIALQTATAREALPWLFVVEASEPLELPGGAMPALKLTRAPVGPYDARLELWLAPGAAYAPVRLRLTQPSGDWVDQLWSSTDSAQ
ncbi:hypothetical protein GCM10027034_45070 [Ramlibacter solisilvae]|uniref:DUF3108 domain-containing protein n=1 Tax=Ramlibacter tataouinensis TaxID=94132 RepID=UPI0011AE72A5|nr:DUF3108 domain-containing protein [Ramlibacter tataouinensis]